MRLFTSALAQKLAHSEKKLYSSQVGHFDIAWQRKSTVSQLSPLSYLTLSLNIFSLFHNFLSK